MTERHLRLELRTPPQWWDLPLDPATRHRDVVALVDARAPATLGRGERAQLIATLEEAAATAVGAGAVLASQIGVVGPGLAFSASVVVALEAIDGSDLAWLERFVGQMPVGPGAVDREVEVHRVELAVGPAVRRRSIRTFVALDTGSGSPEETCIQYFLPVPGLVSTAIVACGSPDTEAVEDLTTLFDAIAGTLKFFADDDLERRPASPA